MQLNNQLAQQGLIRQKDLDEWLNSQVTIQLLEALQERRKDTFEYINLAALSINDIKKLDLHEISKFKGSVQILDEILDLEEFLRDRIELPKEVKDEEAYSTRRESDS